MNKNRTEDTNSLPLRTSETLRERLRELRDSSDPNPTWEAISRLPEFVEIGIPAGTLCSVYHGAPVPKKYRRFWRSTRKRYKIEIAPTSDEEHERILSLSLEDRKRALLNQSYSNELAERIKREQGRIKL